MQSFCKDWINLQISRIPSGSPEQSLCQMRLHERFCDGGVMGNGATDCSAPLRKVAQPPFAIPFLSGKALKRRVLRILNGVLLGKGVAAFAPRRPQRGPVLVEPVPGEVVGQPATGKRPACTVGVRSDHAVWDDAPSAYNGAAAVRVVP